MARCTKYVGGSARLIKFTIMESIFDYNIKIRNCFLSRDEKYLPDICFINHPQSDNCYFNK